METVILRRTQELRNWPINTRGRHSKVCKESNAEMVETRIAEARNVKIKSTIGDKTEGNIEEKMYVSQNLRTMSIQKNADDKTT